MTTRTSVVMWSAGSGVLLGLFVDATLIGLLAIVSAMIPSLVPRSVPKWAVAASAILLAAVPVIAGILGYLEGRLKAD